jgi:hypothetical protein
MAETRPSTFAACRFRNRDVQAQPFTVVPNDVADYLQKSSGCRGMMARTADNDTYHSSRVRIFDRHKAEPFVTLKLVETWKKSDANTGFYQRQQRQDISNMDLGVLGNRDEHRVGDHSVATMREKSMFLQLAPADRNFRCR